MAGAPARARHLEQAHLQLGVWDGGVSHERHPEPLHHATRANVVMLVHREDAVEATFGESEIERCARAFGCETAVPKQRIEAIADLNRREDLGKPNGDREPAISDELPG